ncbi:nuclear transport factor 2 family protein [Tabrizicola sp. J26]|uniref:YybH family protein n=1 Tax=Alitabrizicola rongguiensis TaxID=2909234 RepID=UPI001F3AAC5A|nr:nuclear transport factor 2 family protein [Tabrizicola rongguiensis]MCF1707325.1 nuclear transport factor 2 family protein [Tabrizicola rongguiensis]
MRASLALAVLLAFAPPAFGDGGAVDDADLADSLTATVEAPPPSTDGSADADKDEAEIRARLQEWSDAFAKKDVAAACDLFSADVVAEIQDGPTADHAAVCSKIGELLGKDDVELTYTPQIDEVLPMGDYALIRLTWSLRIDRNGDVTTSSERGFDLFRKEADGKWRIVRYLAYTIE